MNTKNADIFYTYHPATNTDTAWIGLPNNGGEVGDLMDITRELNKLVHAWNEKCIEADTLRQHLSALHELLDANHDKTTAATDTSKI